MKYKSIRVDVHVNPKKHMVGLEGIEKKGTKFPKWVPR